MCYIPRRSTSSKRKRFQGCCFFTMYGHGGHLGHVTNHMSLNFNFLVPTSLNAEFDLNGPLVSEKVVIFTFSCGGTKVAKFDHTIK